MSHAAGWDTATAALPSSGTKKAGPTTWSVTVEQFTRSLASGTLNRSMRSSFLAIVAAALIAGTTLSGFAVAAPTRQQKLEARANANAGLKAFKAGDFSLALERFSLAEEFIHAPPHLLYMARANDRLGEMLAARELYQRIIDEELPKRRAPKAFKKAQKDARAELDDLETRIPKLSIEVSGLPPEQVSLTLSDKPVEADSGQLDLNPGEYTVVATADGHHEARQTIVLEAGQQETVTLTLEPVPVVVEPPPEQPLPIPPLVLIGGGAVGLGVGIVTGVMALNAASELRDLCHQNPCPTEHESLADDANLLGTVSTVGFVVGGVAAAAGGAWLIWGMMAEPSSDEAATAQWPLMPMVGPGYAGITGRF
ncbi:MAG: hypothetical protein DRI90_15900 [Deltaproteobacteria bacterium]|nr:MAG: hypothetical protein DRI90_15900 [Deltaproteobacteria bacterium]